MHTRHIRARGKNDACEHGRMRENLHRPATDPGDGHRRAFVAGLAGGLLAFCLLEAAGCHGARRRVVVRNSQNIIVNQGALCCNTSLRDARGGGRP